MIESPQKEGLQTAVDFTKFLLTLAGGAIAFAIQPNSGSNCVAVKALYVLSTLSLAVCVISGLFVFAGSCVLLGSGDYDLQNKYVKTPGKINIFSFAIGFLFLAVAVLIKIVKG